MLCSLASRYLVEGGGDQWRTSGVTHTWSMLSRGPYPVGGYGRRERCFFSANKIKWGRGSPRAKRGQNDSFILVAVMSSMHLYNVTSVWLRLRQTDTLIAKSDNQTSATANAAVTRCQKVGHCTQQAGCVQVGYGYGGAVAPVVQDTYSTSIIPAFRLS